MNLLHSTFALRVGATLGALLIGLPVGNPALAQSTPGIWTAKAPMPAVRCLERVMSPVLPAGWRASGAGTLGAAPAPAAVTSPSRTRVAAWSREGRGYSTCLDRHCAVFRDTSVATWSSEP